MKKKKCKICKNSFEPKRQLQPTCENMDCMIEYANRHLNKKATQTKQKARKELRAFNNSDKTILKRNTQILINKYARLRDLLTNGHRCCTCTNTGKMDGGHFLPTSGYSAIRYNVNQIHQQCVPCNQYNGGRPKEYRDFMISKYGEEYTKFLESHKGVLRSYSVEYYQRLIKIMRIKIRRIEKKLT